MLFIENLFTTDCAMKFPIYGFYPRLIEIT